MTYLIHTGDGCIRIGLSDAEAAAEKMVELLVLGHSVEVRDFNGRRFEVRGLLQEAAAIDAFDDTMVFP